MDRSKDKLINRKELVEILGISSATYDLWVKQKRITIPYIEIGESKRWWQSDVYTWLEQHKKTQYKTKETK